MIEHQPAAEELDGFVRGVAVERHHGAGTARSLGDLGAKLIADRRHFDAELTAVDDFFVALDGNGGDSILAS